MLKQNIYTGWRSIMNLQVRIIIFIQHDNYRRIISSCEGLLLQDLLKTCGGHVLLHVYGFLWVSMFFYGFLWISMVLYDILWFLWFSVIFYGFL